MIKLKSKKILQSLNKAFVLNDASNQPVPVKEPKKKRSKPEAKPKKDPPPEEPSQESADPEAQPGPDPDPASEPELEPVPEPVPQPKPKSPKATKSKPKPEKKGIIDLAPKLKIKQEKPAPEYLSFETLLSRRRSQIGQYASAVEHSRCKNVPKSFLDTFLRNALLDNPEVLYFIVKDSPPLLDPKLLHESIEAFKNNKLESNSEIITELKARISEKKSLIDEYEEQQASIEKMGAKLIRLKKKYGEPTNAKEKKDRKDRVNTIKKLKSELNHIIASIEEESQQVQKLEYAVRAPLISLNVMNLIKHTNEDGKIVQAASFASWVGDSPDLDFRYFLLTQWDNTIIPLKHSNGETVQLEYRPSSSHGILLAKFIFPYAEEGNWKRILTKGFLQADDYIIESTKPLPKAKKNLNKMPALKDLFFVYTIFTLSLENIPPITCENYPSFRLEIKSNLKECEICDHVSHQTSKCPQNSKKTLSSYIRRSNAE